MQFDHGLVRMGRLILCGCQSSTCFRGKEGRGSSRPGARPVRVTQLTGMRKHGKSGNGSNSPISGCPWSPFFPCRTEKRLFAPGADGLAKSHEMVPVAAGLVADPPRRSSAFPGPLRGNPGARVPRSSCAGALGRSGSQGRTNGLARTGSSCGLEVRRACALRFHQCGPRMAGRRRGCGTSPVVPVVVMAVVRRVDRGVRQGEGVVVRRLAEEGHTDTRERGSVRPVRRAGRASRVATRHVHVAVGRGGEVLGRSREAWARTEGVLPDPVAVPVSASASTSVRGTGRYFPISRSISVLIR